LGLAPVAVATVAMAGQESSPAVHELAVEHQGDPSVLIDLTKCIGCGKCVDACKADNNLPWRDDQPAVGADAVLASSNYTVVQAEPRGSDGGVVTVKRQCLHCLEPACASVCFVRALQKSDAGPVTYDPNRCIGCRYCMMACPFGVPTFDWESTFGKISKCDLCADRTSQGRPTACAEACPSGAITYGTRGANLADAHRRIQGGGYVDHVYGENEVGGTSVLYVSDIPFEKLGFTDGLPEEPLPEYTWQITRLIPPAAAAIGATLITLYLRRMKIIEAEEAAAGEVGPPAPHRGEEEP
jgi:formate dehydrogenase iron-sulfur subunit